MPTQLANLQGVCFPKTVDGEDTLEMVMRRGKQEDLCKALHEDGRLSCQQYLGSTKIGETPMLSAQ